MMESENAAETVNLKETPTCSSTNGSQDIESNSDISEGCKISMEICEKCIETKTPDCSVALDPDSRCTRSPPQASDSIPEPSNACQESFQQNETNILQKFAARHKYIHETLKAIEEKYAKTRILNSDTDECGHSDVHGDASPNEETSEMPVMEDSSSVDARRTRRKSKRKLASDFCCPVCGITVREPELAAHYAQEVEKLTKIPGNLMKLRRRKSEGISTTFVQVKSNRENRLTAKVAKYAAKASKEIQCPICKLRISGCEEDVNKHVALCVQNEDDFDEHIVVDDDEEEEYESFEEYEQPRVEPLEKPTRKRTRNDENEEVEVDIDDTKTYGDPQYTDFDVITKATDENSEELRKAVFGNPSAQPLILESRKWVDIVDAINAKRRKYLSGRPISQLPTDNSGNEQLEDNKSDENCRLPTDNSEDELKLEDNKSDENVGKTDQTLTSLKEKIKDLEDQNKSVKCLICMESYTKPVVSTTCWHVHCEECWLMTMGVKKLCPQCNMIVFPSDLRKIYL